MGVFDFIMKGMGFSGGEQKPKKQPKKEPATSMIPNEKYSSFDNGMAKTFTSSNLDSNAVNLSQIPAFNGTMSGKNVVIYAPKTDKDIQLLIECLRRHESCIVNLGNLQNNEAEKVLDFLSGAVYALRGGIRRLQGDLFLLTPEGINIMTQSNPQPDNQ